jgi:DNA-binding response OmpR family regulator
MRLIHLPAQTEAPHAPTAIAIVGLLGATPARALASAGYAVSLQPTIEFDRLAMSDLLVLAPAPPEPPAWALIQHLRQRSAIRVLALVPEPTDDDRRLLRKVGADGWLDATSTDGELAVAVRTLLDDRSATGHRTLVGTNGPGGRRATGAASVLRRS